MQVLRAFIVSLVVAGGVVLAVGAQSAEPTKSKKTISVTETELHAEGEKAELCFHLDASIEIADREEIAAALLLVEDAKRRKISPRDLSLTPTQICVQNLDHRRRYQATLKKLTGQKGERLAQAFTVSAVVPDRKPYLRFIGDFKADSLPRHTKEGTGGLAHQLDAVNIPAARLTLYHFPKPESFAGAWQQFQQIKISPAESLLFAKDRGQVVFESDLVFDAKPNKQQTLTAPLPEDAVLKKGLYYLAAMPQGKAGSNPALFTGQWFLVSDVRLLAARTTQGWHVSVFDGTAGTPLAGAEVTFWSRKGDALYVAKTDANGQANVSAKNVDETSLFLMTAQEAHGAIDLLAYTQDLAVSGALEPAHALIRPQRDAYMPGDVAEFFLSAESRSGAIQDVGPSVLRWVRSDGTTEHEVDTIPVPGGGARAAMPVPLGQEAVHWRAVWAKKDGTVLGQAFVPVMRDPRDLQITMSVGDDGGREELAGWASLQVRDQGGQPIPYKNGMLDVSPALPTDPAWPDYLFGIERPTSDETIQSFPFTTDAQGRAHIDIVPREPSQWGFW